MRKSFSVALVALLVLSSCANEYNAVFKTTDYNYKYEYAKEAFAYGKYSKAIPLLTDLITITKGTSYGEECLYLLGLSQYQDQDYVSAAEAFKRYVQSYPKGTYAEMASFYVGQSLYMSTPEPRLDQTQTYASITAFQSYMDLYPDARLRSTAQERLFELQDKLVRKELYNSRLYYDLGPYFGNCTYGGNNYEACIITAENALKDYPYSKLRENFSVLIMKSKYELARQSVESKRLERYQDAEEECYGFINEYPDSKERPTAEKYIAKCKEVTGNSSKE